jgi:CheY-like chemotaxis protein
MKNILVIDDSSELRLAIVTTLVHSGYSAWQAQDGREGIQMVIFQKPDLIICDIKMPGLDGYRTLEAIRKCSGTAAIPFILMSGSTGREDFRHGMALGADDYLSKPFSSTELIAAVKSRFARQADLQIDTIHRIEQRHSEDFRQLSTQLTAPGRKILTADNARLRQNPVTQEIAGFTTRVNQPTFCLD